MSRNYDTKLSATRNYEEKLSQEILSQYISSREKCGNYRDTGVYKKCLYLQYIHWRTKYIACTLVQIVFIWFHQFFFPQKKTASYALKVHLYCLLVCLKKFLTSYLRNLYNYESSQELTQESSQLRIFLRIFINPAPDLYQIFLKSLKSIC